MYKSQHHCVCVSTAELRNYAQPQPKTLQVGTKTQRPSNVPTHLPSFPDPHTYIRTPVSREYHYNLLYTAYV